MKKIFLSITVILLYMVNYGQGLQIKIYNKTGYDIDSISIGQSYVGKIKKNDFIMVLNCKKLILQDEIPYPYALPEAIIHKKKKSKTLINLCGTGKKTIVEGNYEFDITIKELKDGYRLVWEKHMSN